MQPPAKEASVARAAQILLYWEDRDIQPLLALLARIEDLNEAKDVIIAMAMFSDKAVSQEHLTSIATAVALTR